MATETDSFHPEEQSMSERGSASTIAFVDTAMSSDPDLDSSEITMRMLGPVLLPEGYINDYADRERAISIAALIAGPENVQDRMLGRVIEHEPFLSAARLGLQTAVMHTRIFSAPPDVSNSRNLPRQLHFVCAFSLGRVIPATKMPRTARHAHLARILGPLGEDVRRISPQFKDYPACIGLRSCIAIRPRSESGHLWSYRHSFASRAAPDSRVRPKRWPSESFSKQHGEGDKHE